MCTRLRPTGWMSWQRSTTNPLTAERQEKLRVMVSGCNDELKEFSAWPSGPDPCREERACMRFCHATDHRLRTDPQGIRPLSPERGVPERGLEIPCTDRQRNLAAAFYIIHKYGYVIGDVNEGTILVTKKACVRLIDCDSFQVQAHDRIYHCEVGVPQFTPPELQKSKDFKMLRTQNHDNFGLAILIFLLLFMGRHPFSGVYKGKDDMPIERAIAEYRFAFGRNAALKAMSPPPNAVGLSIVPGEVASLFEQAFTESALQSWGRPTANDWWNVLDALEKRLKKCSTESMHTYYSGLAACPWCGLENTTGILLFLSSDSISRIDVGTEWQKVPAVKPPGPIPVISPRNYRCAPAPLPPMVARIAGFRKFGKILAITFFVASVLLLFLWSEWDLLKILASIVPAVLGALILVIPGKDTAEKKRRKKVFEDAKYSWKLWEKKWIAEAGDAGFTCPGQCPQHPPGKVRGDRERLPEGAR